MKAFHLTLTIGLLLTTLFFSHGHCGTPLTGNTVESPHDVSSLDDQILHEVSRHIGVRYKRGGSTMSGMDCSGFVRRVYRHIFYVDLPPTAACQSRLSIFDDVPIEGLRTGDLIYFSRTPKREKINHVGLYLADGEFAHATEAKGVTVSSLSESHWKVRVKKIKRISNGT
jgi:murein DD-endopeptidase / murein LD-carboxypeptidase